MGFRIRSLHYAMFVLVFIAIAVLPGNWSPQIPGSPFGPATAWAGGTPDETLNPPPSPPQGASHAKSPHRDTYAVGSGESSDRLDQASVTSAKDGMRWYVIWRVVRATVLRI